MKKIAKFEKVSKDQFLFDMQKPEKESLLLYQDVILPKRATEGSAGYDFFATEDLLLKAGETRLIPTGVRVFIEKGWFLAILPRSGLGFKYRIQLDNTIGIIDSDYYSSSNEGHIFIKITNDSKEGKEVLIKKGDGFAQGIFIAHGLAEEREVKEKRDGGFGSTSKKTR